MGGAREPPRDGHLSWEAAGSNEGAAESAGSKVPQLEVNGTTRGLRARIKVKARWRRTIMATTTVGISNRLLELLWIRRRNLIDKATDLICERYEAVICESRPLP